MEEDDDEELLYQDMEEEAYELDESLTDDEDYEDEEYEDEYEEYEAQYEYPENDDDSRSKEEKTSGHSPGIHPFFFMPGAATSSAANHCSEKGLYAQNPEEKPQLQSTGKSVLGVVLLLVSALIGYMACVA